MLGVWALGPATQNASASPVKLHVVATGDKEVNMVSGGGSAVGDFTYDAATKVLTYDVKVFGVSGNSITASHIHRGAVGVSGPPVYTLSSGGAISFSGSITLTDADVADLTAGKFYFNVHSKAYPGGFARGQLELPAVAPTPAPAITPPSTGDAGLLAGGAHSSWAWLSNFAIAAFALSSAALVVRKSS
jgi:hypothetical protein